MTRIITITGGKGGSGKTSSAINIASALNYFGKKSIVVDANLTNPEISAVTDALKTIKLSKELGKDILGVVVNKTNPKNMDMSLENIEAMLETQIIGVIPEDRAMKFATARKDSVVNMYPDSPSSVSYKKLAAHLSNLNFEES